MVISVTDFSGTLTVSVVDDSQYKEQKKEIDLDSEAINKLMAELGKVNSDMVEGRNKSR